MHDSQRTNGLRLRPYIEGVAWGAIAVGMWIYSYAFDRPIASYELGPVWWPRAVLLLILVAAVGAFFADMRRRGAWGDGHPAIDVDSDTEAFGAMDGRARLSLAAAMVVPLIYVWLLPRAGFFAATPFFIAVYMYLLGVSNWRTIAVTTAIAYAALLLVFSRLLFIPLPTGNWAGFYDFSNWLLVLLRS